MKLILLRSILEGKTSRKKYVEGIKEDKFYYIENYEGGAIYNKEVIQIGIIKNNTYIFF